MSGKPLKTIYDNDINRKKYMQELVLRSKIDNDNLKANQSYIRTGAINQLPDTRTLDEKLNNIYELKIMIVDKLKQIMSNSDAHQVIQGLDNNSLKFLAQRIDYFVNDLKPKYSLGIPYQSFKIYFENAINTYNDFQDSDTTLSLLKTQAANSTYLAYLFQLIRNNIGPKQEQETMMKINHIDKLMNLIQKALTINQTLIDEDIQVAFNVALKEAQDVPSKQEVLSLSRDLKVALSKNDAAKTVDIVNAILALLENIPNPKPIINQLERAINDAIHSSEENAQIIRQLEAAEAKKALEAAEAKKVIEGLFNPLVENIANRQKKAKEEYDLEQQLEAESIKKERQEAQDSFSEAMNKLDGMIKTVKELENKAVDLLTDASAPPKKNTPITLPPQTSTQTSKKVATLNDFIKTGSKGGPTFIHDDNENETAIKNMIKIIQKSDRWNKFFSDFKIWIGKLKNQRDLDLIKSNNLVNAMESRLRKNKTYHEFLLRYNQFLLKLLIEENSSIPANLTNVEPSNKLNETSQIAYISRAINKVVEKKITDIHRNRQDNKLYIGENLRNEIRNFIKNNYNNLINTNDNSQEIKTKNDETIQQIVDEWLTQLKKNIEEGRLNDYQSLKDFIEGQQKPSSTNTQIEPLSNIINDSAINRYIDDISQLNETQGRQPQLTINGIINQLNTSMNVFDKLNNGEDNAARISITTDWLKDIIAKMEANKLQNILSFSEFINLVMSPERHQTTEQSTGSGLKKKKGMKGRGLIQINLEKAVEPLKKPDYIQFGRHIINEKRLRDGIVMIKKKDGLFMDDLRSTRVNKNVQHVLEKIIGGNLPGYDDYDSLSNDEKEYLYYVAKKCDLVDKLMIPTPNKSENEKLVNRFEIMKGQIMAGNDNKDLIREFKKLLINLSDKKLLPRRQASETLIEIEKLF